MHVTIADVILPMIGKEFVSAVSPLNMLPRVRGRAFLLRGRSLATHAPQLPKDCSSITPPYEKLLANLERVRSVVKRPLTLAEKILYSHVIEPEKSLAGGGRIRGESYLQLNPERVAMQDASAQ